MILNDTESHGFGFALLFNKYANFYRKTIYSSVKKHERITPNIDSMTKRLFKMNTSLSKNLGTSDHDKTLNQIISYLQQYVKCCLCVWN